MILFQCYSIKSWKSCHDNISLGNKPWSRSSSLHLSLIRPRQRQCQSISGSNKTYVGEQEERGGLGLVSVRECISTGSFDVFEKCIRQMSTYLFFNSVLKTSLQQKSKLHHHLDPYQLICCESQFTCFFLPS